jgi:hypothetical protein
MKSSIATAAVKMAVISAMTTYRLITAGLLLCRERSSDLVISLTAFA